MVACEQEQLRAVLAQPADTLGELTLICLAGVTALVGVAAEEDQIDLVVQGIVYQLVEGGQEIKEAG